MQPSDAARCAIRPSFLGALIQTLFASAMLYMVWLWPAEVWGSVWLPTGLFFGGISVLITAWLNFLCAYIDHRVAMHMKTNGPQS
jgi:hypothetical protein